MDEITAVTLILSIWGSCLSTILAVKTLLGDRLKLKAGISMAIATIYSKPRVALGIEAVNVGKRPLTLDSRYINIVKGIPGKDRLFPKGEAILHCAPELPCKLNDGEKFSVIIDGETLANDLTKVGYSGEIKLVASFTEASGKEFKSKPLVISVDLLRNRK